MLEKVYQTFFTIGEVTEGRMIGGISGKNKAWAGSAFGAKPILSGCFDNAKDLAQAACASDQAGAHGSYFVLNPIVPAFLSRAHNRLVANPSQVTSDENIAAIRWLPIDLDPKIQAGGNRWIGRPGISSTDEELGNAMDLGRRITEWLEGELGFAKAIRACSGNGVHLNYRLPDLENTRENVQLVRDCLHAIEERFRNDKVDIDLSVYNPARIWKIYGTTARKGDATEERPHRKSYLFDNQPLFEDVPVCGMDQLMALQELAPKTQSKPVKSQLPISKSIENKSRAGRSLGPMDIGAYLDHYGHPHKIKSKGSDTYYCLEECVFDSNHTRGGCNMFVL